jgi:aspartyl-tRNA(Asn)/glutamyl-tRNA(Gln) amidotransferase subunit A
MDTILELSEALRQRKISSAELTRVGLARIEKLNPTLNAFVAIMADAALEQARAADQEMARDRWRGPLHGIPIGLKDLIDTAGLATTAASELYKHRIPIHDAEVVQKLKNAGAILLGKQNLHEFAYGGSSLISCYGEVHNPWNPERISGGSSGGSASAVAVGMGYAAIGTDTAGSIREPSALCGVVGLKPTYARVSARGVIPLSESLDHVGPITRTVADAALVLRTIADPSGDRVPGLPPDDFVETWKHAPKLRIGVPRAYFYDDLDPEVARAATEALMVLQGFSSEMREITLSPDIDRTLQAAEAYAFHAESAAKTPALYQSETLRRILTGAKITREEYEGSRKKLEASRCEIAKMFEEVDVIVTPTTPIPAPEIAELKKNPDQLRPRELALLRNTRPFNVWGIPAISVPCGFTQAGLPIGLQIAAATGRDDLALEMAYAYEQATAWHKRRPELEGRAGS